MILILINPRLHLTLSLLLDNSQVILHQAVKVICIIAILEKVLLQTAVECSICARCAPGAWLWRA